MVRGDALRNFLKLHARVVDIRKEGKIPSSDLVLLSRDSTMGKIYPPRPPVGVVCRLKRTEGCGRRTWPARAKN